MLLGIVGSAADKFTPETELKARQEVIKLLSSLGPLDCVVSGKCPEGGIDIWAIEEAEKLGIQTIEYPPKVFEWERGYKPRNIQIAKASDKVVCLSVLKLPPDYKGMTHLKCYHHDDEPDFKPHVKSGGCWTTKYARSLGKPTELIIIS